MPPGARSRGCDACQRRKIKCDGKTPVCGKCERLGIECSGPVVGPIILPFDPQKTLPREKRNASSTEPNDNADSVGPSTTQSLMPFAPYGVRVISENPTMKDWFALRLQEIVYIPHQRHHSMVPDLVKFSGSNEYPLLQRAIWAASAALNGAASNSPQLIKKSQEIYAGALKTLLKELSETDAMEGTPVIGPAQKRSVSVEMVGAAVLFVWYEAIIGTSPTGWIAHAFGVGRLVLRRSPEDYRLSLSHNVFRTARFIVANCSILTVQPTPFGTLPWLTIPFTLSAKTAFDRMLDFMLVIPKSLSWVSQKCTSELPIRQSVEAAKVIQEVQGIETSLKSFLLTYEDEVIEAGEKGLYLDRARDRIDSTGEYHPKTRHYYSEEITECVTHYEMCRLLVALLKAAFSDADGFIACRAEAVEHSASTLSGVAYSEANSTTRMAREHFAYVCILIIVLVASPSEAHRKYAKLKIESWGGGNGLVGASPFHPIARWSALRTVWEKMAPQLGNIM